MCGLPSCFFSRFADYTRISGFSMTATSASAGFLAESWQSCFGRMSLIRQRDQRKIQNAVELALAAVRSYLLCSSLSVDSCRRTWRHWQHRGVLPSLYERGAWDSSCLKVRRGGDIVDIRGIRDVRRKCEMVCCLTCIHECAVALRVALLSPRTVSTGFFFFFFNWQSWVVTVSIVGRPCKSSC